MVPAELIKKRVSLDDLLGRLGYTLGHSRKIKCPAHEDKTPSLHVYPNGLGWYCYSCGAGGSVIDFYMHYTRLDFTGAVTALADMYGIEGGQLKNTDKIAIVKRRRITDQKEKRKKEAEAEYEHWLKKWKAAKAVMDQDHDDLSDELVEACQNIHYYQYRMEEAFESIYSTE